MKLADAMARSEKTERSAHRQAGSLGREEFPTAMVLKSLTKIDLALDGCCVRASLRHAMRAKKIAPPHRLAFGIASHGRLDIYKLVGLMSSEFLA